MINDRKGLCSQNVFSNQNAEKREKSMIKEYDKVLVKRLNKEAYVIERVCEKNSVNLIRE